jgi:hypothetical protein
MFRNRFAVFAAALTLAVGLSARPALAQTWTFDDVVPPFFEQTNGGISAYFAGNLGIVNLDILSNPFRTLTGHVLQTKELSPVFSIGLSQAVTSMTFNWAMIAPNSARTLTLITFLGGVSPDNIVAQRFFSGSPSDAGDGLSVIEGFASYSGSAFDSALITSDVAYLAIDNVSVSTVPEPMTVSLMAAGLAGLGFVSRRRRRALVA